MITIVIPALTEAAVIGAVVRSLRESPPLQQAGISDIVVVDNGSTDATAEEARAAGARVVSEPRRGYGWACLAGVRAAGGAELIVLMDGDGSDAPEDVLRVVAPVQAGTADLAMGSRVRGACERGALTPQQRIGNAVGARALRALYGVRVSDLGPLRAIRRDTLLRLEMGEMAYGWSTEMLAKAGRLGLRVCEVPVSYRRRAGGKSKVAGTLTGTLRASAHILRTLARYLRWRPQPLAPAKHSPRQALCILARLPLVGQVKTRLGRELGHEAVTELYAAFLRDLDARFTPAAARDGYDLYWCYAAPDHIEDAAFAAQVTAGARLLRQRGEDLNARLLSAFRQLGDRGYDRVLVVGSDSPHLPAASITQAFAALAECDVVIGPAYDGGYYLLGQRLATGPADLFGGIPMSTAEVFDQTVARARSFGLTVALAPATFDIDMPADLARLADALAAAPSDEADPCPSVWAALADLPLADLPLAAGDTALDSAGAGHSRGGRSRR